MSQERVAPAERVDGEVHCPRRQIDQPSRPDPRRTGRAGPTSVMHLRPQTWLATAACLRACGVWVRDFPPDRYALDGSRRRLSCALPRRAGLRQLGHHDAAARRRSRRQRLRRDARRRRHPAPPADDPRRRPAARHGRDASTPRRRERRRFGFTASTVLTAVTWQSPVASAQVKSAILLAGLRADGPTTVVEPVPTRDHTERMLRMCGVDVVSNGAAGDGASGSRSSRSGCGFPGDLSSAAFFLALAASRPGWRVRCPGVGLNPGRTGILDVLEAMGAQVRGRRARPGRRRRAGRRRRGARGRPRAASRSPGALTVRCIDELPVIAVLASQAEGDTEIRDAGELRNKESDRIAMLETGSPSAGRPVREHRGHRSTSTARCGCAPPISMPPAITGFAMAWAIAAALVPSAAVVADRWRGTAAVSYPASSPTSRRLLAPDLSASEAEQQVRTVAGLDDLEPAHRDRHREHVRPLDVCLRAGGVLDEPPRHARCAIPGSSTTAGDTAALDPSRRVAREST